MTAERASDFSEEQIEIIRAGVQRRESTTERRGVRAIDRIEVAVVRGLEYDARNLAEPEITMHVGEPPERGGEGRGASPLAHFLTGAGACLLNQFIRVAVSEGLPVSFKRANVRGEFRRDPGAGIDRISFEVHGEGDLSDEIVNDLTDRAESLCYIHCTLRRAVQMTTVLVLDGRERVRRVAGPEATAAD